MLTRQNSCSSFILTFIITIFLGALFLSQPTFAGAGFSEEGDALSKAIYKELIKEEICSNYQKCWDLLQMYRADGKKIHLNMYGQRDTQLASKVTAFLVREGIKITGGMPIALKVFPAKKTEYLGFKSIFGKNDEILMLEIYK